MDYGYLVSNDVIGPNVYEAFQRTPEGLDAAMRWAGKLLGQDVIYEADGPQGLFRNFGPCQRTEIWEREGRKRRLLYTFTDRLAPEALLRSRPSALAESTIGSTAKRLVA